MKKGSEPWIRVSLAEDASNHLGGGVAKRARAVLENKEMAVKVKCDKIWQLGYYIHVSFIYDYKGGYGNYTLH